MFKRLCAVLLLLTRTYQKRRTYQDAFMAYQIKMLKRRLGDKRIVPSEEECRELLALGAKFDHDVDSCLEVVTPDTYKRWLRKKANGIEIKQVGRKRMQGEVVELIIRMRKENLSWGYLRIVGELMKLGITVGYQTVKRILERTQLDPKQDKELRRKPVIPWSQFIAMHHCT